MSNKELFNLLDEAIESDHLATTRHLCEHILSEDPDDWTTLLRYAEVLTNFAQYQDAEHTLEHAEEHVPEEQQALYFNQKGHLHNEQSQFPEALEAYLTAHRLSPDEAGPLIDAAGVAFQTGDLSQAEKLARQATACEEGAIDEAYFNLGGYLLAQHRTHEAKTAYEAALKIDPEYDEAQEKLEDISQFASLA